VSATASITASTARASRAASALRDGQFRRYLVGQACSELGDQVWYVALSWSAVRLGSPATAGVVLTLASAPRLTLMLFGGVIADRFDIRRLMLGSDSLRTIITFAAAAIALTQPSLVLLGAMALIYGAADGIFMPAAGAMQPRLLRSEQYSSGAVASNLLARGALTLGAPAGGLMVALGGLPLALAVNGVTFAISVATLATVHPRPVTRSENADQQDQLAPQPTYLRDFIVGGRFLLSQPILGPLTAISVLSCLGFVGPMNIGLAELSRIRGWGAGGIGVLLAGFGIGAVAATVAMLRWKIRRDAGIWITAMSGISGCAVFALALAPSLAAAAAATVTVGLVSGPMAVASSVLMQEHTPDELRGRISSFNLLSGFGAVPLAMIGTGAGIATLGITGTFAACGACEAAALLFLLAPGFRSAQITS
jgi:MFS family permease